MTGDTRASLGDQEVIADIRRFIEEETLWGASGEPLTDEQPLIDSGLLDSFDLADLVSHLQDRFGIRIAPADMSPADFETVRTICALVLRVHANQAR